jgi:hypothetical protein
MRKEEHECKVDAVLSHIATGKLTLDDLERAVTGGRSDVERLGRRVEPTTVEALAAGEEALERIKTADRA